MNASTVELFVWAMMAVLLAWLAWAFAVTLLVSQWVRVRSPRVWRNDELLIVEREKPINRGGWNV